GEVGVGCRDGADVFGPVQLPRRVFGRAVESDGHDPAAEVVGESVVVVPAVSPGLVAVAVGADAGQFAVVEVAVFREVADSDGAATGVQLNGAAGAVGRGDGLRFESG